MGEERKLILEMIKDGKITAEEGKELLEALGESNNENKEKRYNSQEGTSKSKEYTHESNWGFFEGLKNLINFGDVTGPTHDFVEEYTHKFTSKNITMKVKTKTGTVTIKGWDKDECSIKLTKRVKGMSENKAREFAQSYQILNLSENSLVTEYIKNKHLNISFEIYVPKKIVIENFECSSVNGKVNTSDFQIGCGNFSSVNGKVFIENLWGSSLEVSGVNGLIDISSKIDSVKCSTVNGSIKIRDTNKNEGDIRASTVNGPIKIGLPKGVSGVRISSSSVNGRTKVDHPDLRIVSESGKLVNRSSEVVSDGPVKRTYNVSAVNGSLTICEIGLL